MVNPNNILAYGGHVYSISDRNKYGEYVVVKSKMDLKGNVDVKGSAIIPAKSMTAVRMYLKQYPFDKFKQIPLQQFEQ